MGADVTKKLDIIISSKAQLGDLEKVKKVLIASRDRLTELEKKYKSATARMGGFASGSGKAKIKVQELERELFKKGKRVKDLQNKVRNLQRQMKSQDTTTKKVEKSTKRYRGEVDKLSRSYKRAEKAGRSYDNTQGKIRGHTEGLRRVIGALRNQILLFIFALRGLINVITSSVEASNQLEAAMVGLRAVSEKTGTSFHDAQVFMQEFTEKGLISVADTAAGLKNLLSAGFGMPEAIQLMKTLGDAAAFNRQGTLEYGAAIVGATQGIKNQNSIMTDNAGITKNLNIMYKEYARTIGKGAMSLNELEKRTAIYLGFLKEGAIFQGNMNLLTETYIGKTQKLSQSIFKAKANFGDLIKTGLAPFVAEIEKVVAALAEWIEKNEILIKSEVKVFLETVTVGLKAMWDILVAVNDAFKIFGTSLKDMIVFFAIFKGASFAMGKLSVVIGGIGKLMKLAFGIQTLRAIANVTKLQTVIFKAGRAFRLAGAIGVTGFSRALIAARVALSAMMGPLGIIIGLITLAGGAYAYFSLKNKQTAKIAVETTEEQIRQARELVRSNYDLSQSMMARYQNQLKSKDLTQQEVEVLKEKLSIEEKLFDFARRAEAVERAREKLKPEDRDPASSFALAFEKVEEARFKSRKELKEILKVQEERVEKEKELAVGMEEDVRMQGQLNRMEQQRLETRMSDKNLTDEQREKASFDIKLAKKTGAERKEELERWLKDQHESLSIAGVFLQALRMMLGIEEKITDKLDDQKKKREASLKSLLGLIAKLKGEIAGLGLVGVAKKLTDFDAKIAGLRVRLEAFRETLAKFAPDELKELDALISQLDELGRTAILSDKVRDLTDELIKLGQTPLEQKINTLNEKIGSMRFELAQTILVLMRTHQVNAETVRWIELWAQGIDELEEKLRDQLRANTLAKFAQQSNDAIVALSRSIFELTAGMAQVPLGGGLFGTGEKGDVDRIRIQLEGQEKLSDARARYFEEVKAIAAFEANTIAEKVQQQIAFIDATQRFETEQTAITLEESVKRVDLVRMEWEQRFQLMEQFVGGWQELGGTLADIWIGQSNEMQAQIDRQRDLMNRGKIDQQQFEDRKAQIERAAQKDREKAAAKFGANMLRQAGQIAAAYLFQAAAAQFATAGATASNAALWSAHFLQVAAALEVAAAASFANPFGGFAMGAAYSAQAKGLTAAAALSAAAGAGSVAAGVGLGLAGIGVGIVTGLGAGAIEANNLGSEGGFLGTPTEDVFEDRNRRLGGSIRAQEVHLSINPVTYIQAEGDIFIGEGITLETFKGLVNEAFVNRTQEALETGELQLDGLVNVKG